MELNDDAMELVCETAFEDGVQRGMLLAGMVVFNMQSGTVKEYTLDDARRAIAGMMHKRSKDRDEALSRVFGSTTPP